MSTDHDALFRAVCADHEDDTPRLAFADWCDENDDPLRAAFIRAQVEFARLTHDGSDSQAIYEFLRDHDWVSLPAAKWEMIDGGIARRLALVARLDELWVNGPTWIAELPGKCGVNFEGFHRGFAGRAVLTDAALLARSANAVIAAAPPVELVCHGLTADEAEQLVDAGLLPWIRGLELHGDYAGGLLELAQHPATGGIHAIRLQNAAGANADLLVEALATSPHWAGLRAIESRGSWFDPTSAEILFHAPHLRSLTRLHLGGYAWTAETMRAFANAAFTGLTDLRFTSSSLDDDAAEVLSNVPSLQTVRYLDLERNQITGRGATALLCSPNLAGMAFLGLAHNRDLRDLDRKALKATPVGGLRHLHCHGCRLMVKDVGVLARSPRLRDLWYLDLDDNGLASGAVREIVRGFKDRCPPIIWLTMNRIDDQSAVLLANWPAAKTLRILQLYQNPLSDFGVRTLLESEYLKNLDGFGVSGVSDSVAQAIGERFRDHGVVGSPGTPNPRGTNW